MKALFILLFCFISGGILHSQTNSDLPVFNAYPEFLETSKPLDSVLQYFYHETSPDSTLTRKWEYKVEDGKSYQSWKYRWIDSIELWKVTDHYEWKYNESGQLVLKAHYDWPMSNGQWGGCSYEGCGMKEWAYDENGNQILWTQSYYSPGRKWEIFEKQENVHDHNNNMVLESVLRRGGDFTNYWWDGEKDEYSYDSKGNKTGYVKYNWASYYPITGREYSDWCPLYKEEIEYNRTGDHTSRAFFVWDYRENEWICELEYPGVNHLEMEHDSEGKQIGVTALICDSVLFQHDNTYNDAGYPVDYVFIRELELMDEFAFFNQHTYVYNQLYEPLRVERKYDSQKRVSMEKRYIWRMSSSSWDKSRTINFTYDTSGNLIEEEIVRDFKTGTERQLRTREQWSHNTSGLIMLHNYQYWSEGAGEWIPQWKEEKSYDSQGRLTLEAYYTWDEDSEEWAGRVDRHWDGIEYVTTPGKYEYKYNEAGNLILYASYAWNETKNDWRGFEMLRGKKEWDYDENGRLFSETGYDWNNDLGDWIPKQKNVFRFDGAGDPLVQYQYSWDPGLNNWTPIIGYFYYYSQSTGIDYIKSEVEIYPNPTSGLIYITGITSPVDVKVYSMQGRLLKSEVHVEGRIDVTELPAGMYLLRLVSDHHTINKVFLKTE